MTWKTLFHLLGALQFIYGCYYDHMYVRAPSTSHSTQFGGKLKFLTFLNAMLQATYFTVALLNDNFGNNEPTRSEKPLIRRIKDTIFSTLSFPVAMFVGITFWGIYAVDREMVLPRSLDPYFPTWLNHVMHTNIVIFALIELVTSFRMYPQRNFGLSVLCTFMLSYLVWLHIIYFRTGVWVYPLFAIMNWPLRIIFYTFNLVFVCALYTAGETINRSVWSDQIEETVKSGKKKAK